MARFDAQRFAERLAALQDQRDMTNARLAKLIGLSLRSLERLRSGDFKRPPKEVVLQRLARVLETTPEIMLGVDPLPDPGPQEARRSVALSLQLRPALRNALSLVALRYGVTPTFVLKMAPLAFEMLARHSLKARAEKIALDALAPMPWSGRDLAAELRTLAAHDLFDKAGRAGMFDPEDWEQAEDAGETDDPVNRYLAANPFVRHLEALAASLGSDLSIEEIEPDEEPRFTLLREDARRLAGGDEALAEAILEGRLMIGALPRELLDEAHEAERLDWLRGQQPEGR